MFIRYFADTTDGAHGQLSRSYLRTLIKIAPTRVITTTPGVFTAKWSPWSELFSTPVASDDFVNVVSCHPTRWAWSQNIVTQFRDDQPLETVNHRIELYTANVRNVLIHCAGPREQDQTAIAGRYEAMVVHDDACAMLWEMAGVRRPHVIGSDAVDDMRAVLFPK